MKISVITPTYNCEKTVERTIRSVISQKCASDYEYILIDGNSKDGTMKIVEKYRSYFSAIISEPDNGLYDAMNKGIERATGDFIITVASDDFLLPDAIKEFENSVKIDTDVWCGTIIVFDDPFYFYRHSDADLNKLYEGCSLRHPASFIRKKAYQKYGTYCLDYSCASDRELFLRFYEKQAKFQVERIPIAFFSYGGISTKNDGLYSTTENSAITSRFGKKENISSINIKKSSAYLLNKKRKEALLSFCKKTYLYRPIFNLVFPNGELLSKREEIKYGLSRTICATDSRWF